MGMKTPLLCIISIAWLVLPSLGNTVESDAILGDWITENEDCRVTIFKKGDHYFGKIAAIKPPDYLPGEVTGMDDKPRRDLNNQDESLRSRPLVGIELMQDFRFDNDKWIDGKIYDPENGKTYQCEMSLAEDGTLHVRGYVGMSFLGRTTVWDSVDGYLEKQHAFLGVPDCSCE